MQYRRTFIPVMTAARPVHSGAPAVEWDYLDVDVLRPARTPSNDTPIREPGRFKEFSKHKLDHIAQKFPSLVRLYEYQGQQGHQST